MSDDQAPKLSRRQQRAEKLRQNLAEKERAAKQAREALKDFNAKDKLQARKDEESRKFEAGAVALTFMRYHPDSEFAAIMRRELNQRVRHFRRKLFAEFGIDPVPPKGSPAEEQMLEEQARKEKRQKPANQNAHKPGLKQEFPG